MKKSIRFTRPEKPPRPRLSLPLSKSDIALEVAAGLGVAGCLAVLTAYGGLPEVIPRHFGLSGEPDAWGGKRVLLLLPAMVTFIYAGLTILNRYPHVYNYTVEITEENAERQYRIARTTIRILKAEIAWIFGWIEWTTVRVARGQSEGLGSYFMPVVMAVMLGTIGWTLVRASRAR